MSDPPKPKPPLPKPPLPPKKSAPPPRVPLPPVPKKPAEPAEPAQPAQPAQPAEIAEIAEPPKPADPPEAALPPVPPVPPVPPPPAPSAPTAATEPTPEELASLLAPPAIGPPKRSPSGPPGKIRSPLASPRFPWLLDVRDWVDAHAADARRAAGRAFDDAVRVVKEKTKDKPRWFLPVVSGGGGLVLLILVLAVGKAACGSKSSAAEIASAAPSPSARPSATATDVVAPQPSAVPAKPPPPPVTCALAGPLRRIAPEARAAAGVEVTPLGSDLAVGFAPTLHRATLEILDGTTLGQKKTLHARSGNPIRRVVALSATKLTLDVDRKADPLHGRRTIAAQPPIDVGAMDDGFAWAPHGSDGAIKLWGLPEAGKPIEAARGNPLGGGEGFAVVFRQGGDVYAGAFGGKPPAPLGKLVRIEGLGPRAGSPAVAASGDRVMLAWADRAAASDPWRLRLATFRVDDASARVIDFATPPGGLGEQTMSPDLTPLADGRFLLVWTEGLATHQVRGAVVGDDGVPTNAFTISADGVDAGQGQAAMLEGGRGAVAFLASTPQGYDVMAVPLACQQKR